MADDVSIEFLVEILNIFGENFSKIWEFLNFKILKFFSCSSLLLIILLRCVLSPSSHTITHEY